MDDSAVAPLDEVRRNDLLELIDDRGNGRGLHITSQLPVEHWQDWRFHYCQCDSRSTDAPHRQCRGRLAGKSFSNNMHDISASPTGKGVPFKQGSTSTACSGKPLAAKPWKFHACKHTYIYSLPKHFLPMLACRRSDEMPAQRPC